MPPEETLEPRAGSPAGRSTLRVLGMVLLAVWALLFAAGALEDLFGIDLVPDFADVKRLFLR
ncbi:MAG: hypothetical protein ACE5JG_10770 [Planctomycetota bacterium]